MKDIPISSKNKKKTEKEKFIKVFAITLAMLILFAISFVVTYNIVNKLTYNKLSSLGHFAVNEFIDIEIPQSYELKNLNESNKYGKDPNIILFSDEKTDLLFNITPNTELVPQDDVANNLGNNLKSALLLDEVYISHISTSNGLYIPVLTFQSETLEGTRFYQYAIINSGYQTILISMNSLTNNFKTFSKIIGSVELI